MSNYEKQSRGVFYKTSFTQDDFKKISFKRNVRKDLLFPKLIKPVRDKLIPLNKKKNDNLMTLLQWVPAIYQNYYKELPDSSLQETDEDYE